MRQNLALKIALKKLRNLALKIAVHFLSSLVLQSTNKNSQKAEGNFHLIERNKMSLCKID